MRLTRSLGLGCKRRVGIPVAGNGRTDYFSQSDWVAAAGAESAVYDCFVEFENMLERLALRLL